MSELPSYVFSRPVGQAYPLVEALSDLLSGRPSERALAINLLHDHRVTVEREEELLAQIHGPLVTGQELVNALADYFESSIRTSTNPAFLSRSTNLANFVNNREGRYDRINEDVNLGRVINVGGLTHVFLWAQQRGVELFRSFNPGPSSSYIIQWLDSTAQRYSPYEIAVAILYALNLYRMSQPYQPSWATLWENLAPYLRYSPTRWLEVVGVCITYPTWIMVLRYPIRAVGTLVRPTQFDGGTYPYHFPSPPVAPLGIGGHPMDLGNHSDGSGLLAEYIHQQIYHDIRHWVEAGRLLVRTESNTHDDLSIQRPNWLEVLTAEYGSSVRSWMPAGM